MNTSIEKYVKRIQYGENENQFGDLRLPEGDGPFQVVIVIHGGFWKAKFDLEEMNKFAEALTANGVATWNIEYRRVGQEGGGGRVRLLIVHKRQILSEPLLNPTRLV